MATQKGQKMGAMTFCGGGHVPHRDEHGRLINEAPIYYGSPTGWAAVSPSAERQREQQEHAARDSEPRYLHRGGR